MEITAEDKLRFFQHFVTGKPFTKEYSVAEQVKIVFRTVCPADAILVNKYDGNRKSAYLIAGIERICIANEETITFVPLTELEFDTQRITPIPQLMEYITNLLGLINIDYVELIAPYYHWFLPLAQELDESFSNPVIIARDPLINNLLTLIYNKVININTLNLNKAADRNLLGLLLQYKQETAPDRIEMTHESPTRSPVDLIKLYEELKEKKNANG